MDFSIRESNGSWQDQKQHVKHTRIHNTRVPHMPVTIAPFWQRFAQNRLALLATIVLGAIVLCVLLGPMVYTSSPRTIDFSRSLSSPTLAYPFGTNDMGQDMLARVLVGGRVSIAVGLCAMSVALVLGTLVGTLAGFVGGLVDILLMRLTDLFLSLPLLPLLLLIIYLFQEPFTHVMGAEYGIFVIVVLVIGGLTWMSVARLVRASILSVREMDFVVAAQVIGVSPVRIVWNHILPNVLNPVIVSATLTVNWAIITESTLSFLGLGFPPDMPTWGRMLYEAKDFLDIAPHMALFPALAIMLTVLCIHFVGDGLQDAFEARG